MTFKDKKFILQQCTCLLQNGGLYNLSPQNITCVVWIMNTVINSLPEYLPDENMKEARKNEKSTL